MQTSAGHFIAETGLCSLGHARDYFRNLNVRQKGKGQPMLKAFWRFIQDNMDALKEDEDDLTYREHKEAEANRRSYQDWLYYRQI